MTIVCYDGKKMVADTLLSTDDMKIPGRVQKIYEPDPDEYWEINGVKVIAFGYSGSWVAIPYIRELLQKGVTHRSVIQPEIDIIFDVLCILETGHCYVMSTNPNRTRGPGAHDFLMMPLEVPTAVGSGTPYAIAVMGPKDKNQAEKGVAAAIRLCPFCGGDTVTWVFPGAPEVPSKRPVLTPEQMLEDESRLMEKFSVHEVKSLVGDLVTKFLNEQKVFTVKEVKE